ncbi:MAG TPA: oxygenase MpaB family protein [Candidatus Binatia bacterium]|nr:oxygenase MpaB family protein [Candidatus Binatia bacterium]
MKEARLEGDTWGTGLVGARAGTVGWRLQREIVLLLAWAPAILLQLAHPLVARAIADHSTFRSGRWSRIRRFQQTLDAMLRIAFGDEGEARAAIARINATHDRVHGRLPEPAGVFAAGTPYSAHDPRLLAWVHVTLVAMNLAVYERYVGPLRGEEKDEYCREASAIEPLLGIPGGTLPRTAAALERHLEERLASGEIAVTELARGLARDVVYPPVPRVAAPVVALMRLPAVGLLPAAVREGYGFAWTPRHEALLRLSAASIRAFLRVTPSIVRHWPAARRL